MIWRNLHYVFFLIAVVLAGAAAYDYFAADAPGAVIEAPDREFPALAVGENVVTFRLDNPTRHAVRVIGCGSC